MRSTAIPMLAACVILCGCHTNQPHPQQHADINIAIVQALNQSMVDEAVVIQHTMYPYHFVRHSAELNSLGERDLGVLLGHYLSYNTREQPLNLRRGPESDELYAERVQTVLSAAKNAGIAAGRVEVIDGFPGGAGMASERVILLLEADRSAAVIGPAIGGAETGATHR